MFSSWNKMHLIYGNESQHSFLCKTLEEVTRGISHIKQWLWCQKGDIECFGCDLVVYICIRLAGTQVDGSEFSLLQLLSLVDHETNRWSNNETKVSGHQWRKLEGKALPWVSRVIDKGILLFEDSLDCLKLPVLETLKLKVLYQNP